MVDSDAASEIFTDGTGDGSSEADDDESEALSSPSSQL
jgi:hypothetical protein